MNHKAIKTVLFAGSIVLTATAVVPAPIEFNQIVFLETFDSYEKDRLMPQGGEWDSIMAGRPEERGAVIREDADSIFNNVRLPDSAGK